MKKLFARSVASGAFLAAAFLVIQARAASSDFVGHWALTPAGGGASWLEIRTDNNAMDGELLWHAGSPEKQTKVWVDGDTLHSLRSWNEHVRDKAGKELKVVPHELELTATLSGSGIQGKVQATDDGKPGWTEEFRGVRPPPMPPAPDLSKVRFGAPIRLFNGKNLDGWAVISDTHIAKLGLKRPEGDAGRHWVPVAPGVANGWSARNGILVNETTQEEGKPGKHYGNLQTIREFEDFRLTLEVKIGPGGNSGVYIRGLYECQVVDSFGKPLDKHNMGAIYGRITPTLSAEKPAGEWQTMDITYVDRHATVILNGKKIIDNQPVPGCTGGALSSDVSRPGPIFLQGDHTGSEYRNIVIRPVLHSVD